MPLQWQKAAVSLVCSTEAETKHGVSSTAAIPWWFLTAGLYCRQMSIGATAVAKGCRLPVLQYCAKHCVCSTAAASWWLLTAGLYCRQMSIGATAVAKGCCQPVLQYWDRDRTWCLQHCCNILVVAHCRLVLYVSINRCHCSGIRLLSACFAVLRQRPSMVSAALLQHLCGCILQACIAGKCQ